MNRTFTALFAGLEALLVAGIGIGIPLVPLTILWATQYGLQIDWVIFWRASVDIWLLGSGVDVTFTLSPAIASALQFPAAGTPFILTMALLGFAMLTLLLGARAGRRIAETPYFRTGLLASIAAFAVISFLVTLSVLWPSARPSIWQGTLLPTLVFAAGLAIGAGIERRRLADASQKAAAGHPAAHPSQLRTRTTAVLQRNPTATAILTAGLTGGAASVALIVVAAALLVAFLLVVSYAKVITLYEGAHAGVLGGIAITLGELALLPNLVLWAVSWLVGPGFAIGTGSSVSPLGTDLGPLPGIPVLGALPTGHPSFGFLGLLVPLIAAFLAAVVVRSRLTTTLGDRSTPLTLVLTGVSIGVVGGVLLGFLAWISSGSAGPGRLADVGSQWLPVGAFGALELTVAATIGLLASRPRNSH